MTRPGNGHGIVKPEVIALNGVFAEHPVEQMAQYLRMLIGVEYVLRQVRDNDGDTTPVFDMAILRCTGEDTPPATTGCSIKNTRPLAPKRVIKCCGRW